MSFELKVELKYLCVTDTKLSNIHLNSEVCKILAQTLVELHSLRILISVSKSTHWWQRSYCATHLVFTG